MVIGQYLKPLTNAYRSITKYGGAGLKLLLKSTLQSLPFAYVKYVAK